MFLFWARDEDAAPSFDLWTDVLSWQNLLSLAALVIAVVTLIHTLAARPIPLVHIRGASRKTENGWDFHGDVLHLFNVGRRPLPVHAVGVVTPQGGVMGPGEPFQFAGRVVQNPETPLVLQPGDMATFIYPANMLDEQRRVEVGYRVDWIRGRRRKGGTRLANVVVRGKKRPAGA